MPAARSSSLAVSGEVSLSFRDELAATIHGAFEVAVEIAVLEISKLVSQALGDVRDQMQETLRENKVLKSRLQTAEHELDAVRKSPRQKEKKQRRESPVEAESVAPARVSSDYRGNSDKPNESFREISEDGRVRSQDFNSSSSSSSSSSSPNTVSLTFLDSQSDPLSDCPEPEKQQKTENAPDVDGDKSQPSALLKQEPVQVKEENLEPEVDNGSGNDADIGSGCSFGPGADEFGPDRLSVVQSKLLEDWKPDPEQQQSNNTESADPGPSQSLEESLSPVGQPSFSASFDTIYQPVERPHGVPQTAPENYGIQIRTIFHPNCHVCKVCGHSFCRASDLRRHHSQRHRPRGSNTGKASLSGRPPKQQIFPPGCSPYHCNECGRDFNRMENLKTHLRIHTGERPYACSVCGVRFRHSGALTRHFRIHTGEKPYICGQCGKRFRNCGGLRFHQKSHGQ